MKVKWSIIPVALLGVLTVFNAQAVDKLEAYKKSKEEFQQAERAVVRKQSTADTSQKELDRLSEQRALWERELAYYKAKLTSARNQLDAFTTSGSANDIAKWKHEVAVMEARVTTAEEELGKVDDQTRVAIQSL